jgi:methylated-DNA-protein-cysteine methyltransferase-like protein
VSQATPNEEAMAVSSYQKIYAVVRRIPRGKVATYGQVAKLAGLPGRARQVGYALHALPRGTAVPWHRVVNAAGAISLRRFTGPDQLQLILLEQEGVGFNLRNRLDLKRVQWQTRRPKRRTRP